MKTNDILELCRAGFTKTEIMSMIKPAEQKPVEQKPVEKKPVEQKPVEQKPAEIPGMEQLTNAVNSLIQTMQASNILNSNNPGAQTESADDILANLIKNGGM